MKINKKNEKNIYFIEKEFDNSSEIIKRTIYIHKKRIDYIYLESVSSNTGITDFFTRDIKQYSKSLKNNIFENLKNYIPGSNVIQSDEFSDILYYLSSGYTVIFIDGKKTAFAIETKKDLDRSISESTSETVIRGPKDSFTENNATNLGLIRKRIKDSKLHFKESIIGRRTKSKVTVCYIDDIAEKKSVTQIIEKINKIDIDGILDTGYIREFLIKPNKGVFPSFKSTDRPDLACNALLEGKIIIMVENSPYVLITPTLFIDFIKNAEDNYQKSTNSNFTILLRYLSFFLTIFTPGIYIALTVFNQEIIPNELLISLAIQREGVPFSTPVSIIIMIITFEILRECDIRIPNSMGAAVSIVGALVLGDAAVSAGIVSPIVIIIVAVTSISGLLFNDVDFVNSLRIWRFIILFFSSIAGLIGFLISVILLTIKLSDIECLNVPYLAPLSPLYLKSVGKSIRINISKDKTRASYLTNNTIKMRDDK